MFRLLTCIAVCIGMLCVAPTAHAQSIPGLPTAYNPDDILSDRVFYNASLWSVQGVQEFFEQQHSALAHFSQLVGGKTLSAADIIIKYAREQIINPQVLVTLVQKEQGLVTTSNASTRALDWATGFGNIDTQTAYKGFANQVYWASKSLGLTGRYNSGSYNYAVGQTTTTLDGIAVTPANSATKNLFVYNPIAGNPAQTSYGGNYAFWRIWGTWFSLHYPNGTLLHKINSKHYYVLENGALRYLVSPKIIDKRFPNQQRAIDVGAGELSAYTAGEKMGFPDGTLVSVAWQKKGPRTIYLITGGMRRGFVSPAAFAASGYTAADVLAVGANDMRVHLEGPTIGEKIYKHPEGALVQVKGDKRVWRIDAGGTKALVWEKILLSTRFATTPIATISKAELDRFPASPNKVLLSDGTLIKAPDGKVYVIADGTRRRILNMKTFDALGYNKANIMSVSKRVIDAHPLGDTLAVANTD